MSSDHLIALSQGGDSAATEALLRQYEPMVWKLTNGFVKSLRGANLDIEDLAQEARIGLYGAISKYDPSREASLTTYCYTGIRFALLRAFKRDDPLTSLDAPFGESEDGKLLDQVHDYREDQPLASAEQAEQTELLRWAIGCLPEKYAQAINRHQHDKTLREVGADIGLSRTRVMQFEEKAKQVVGALLRAKQGTRESWTLGMDEQSYVMLAREYKTCAAIARDLNRSFATIKNCLGRSYRRAVSAGIVWLPEKVRLLHAHRDEPWSVAAEKLGISTVAVRSEARRRWLAKDYGPTNEAEFRRLHALGWSTGELGRHFNRAAWTMSLLQKRLGLASNAGNQRWRSNERRKAAVAALSKRKRQRDQERSWHLTGQDWPLGASLVYHVLFWHGLADRQKIADFVLAFCRRHGWHPSVSSWPTALKWAKWLRDRGYVVEFGAGNQLRQYRAVRPALKASVQGFVCKAG